jgi:hypothetical protein
MRAAQKEGARRAHEEKERLDRLAAEAANADRYPKPADFTAMKPEWFAYSVFDTIPRDPSSGTSLGFPYFVESL